MTRREFERIARKALETLPEMFRSRLENLQIVILESPSPRQSRRHGGRGTSLLGLYEGIPRPERSVEQSGVLPDRITLFKRAIERQCRSRDELVRCIQTTVLHEVGHYFGFTDEELERLGYA